MRPVWAEGMIVEGSWSDLGTRGALVLRGLLTPGELRRQQHLFEARPRGPSIARIYHATRAAPEAIAPIAGLVEGLLPELRATTRLTPTAINEFGSYFATTDVSLGWHTDSLSYYKHQSHRSYINFWIPLAKPDRARGGLSFIPMDRLARECPEIHAIVAGHGAAAWEPGLFTGDAGGREIDVATPVDPSALAESPALEPGDALVLRGDVLHRTQDRTPGRIALSIRAHDCAYPLERRRFFSMGARKYRRLMLERSRDLVALAALFTFGGRERLTVPELERFVQRAKERSPTELALYQAARLAFPVLLSRYRERP